MAGLGRLAGTARPLPYADARSLHIALAAQHGHTGIVRLLLDAGEDPNRYNPDGFHSHSPPLHQAIISGHAEVVKLLVERGAGLETRDTIYQGTPSAGPSTAKSPPSRIIFESNAPETKFMHIDQDHLPKHRSRKNLGRPPIIA